ncbi:MAG: DUF3991 and toprim domain-containing protein [Symbiobacteriaceae bacterium]|nr:DUF3991 and toprim domain-containing protein [Symbiobacteriaceae bacterium]
MVDVCYQSYEAMEPKADGRSPLTDSDELNQQLLDILNRTFEQRHYYIPLFPPEDDEIRNLVQQTLIPQYGFERTMTVLAHVVMKNPDHHEHLSADNLAWAKSMRPILTSREYEFNVVCFYPDRWDASLDTVIKEVREHAEYMQIINPAACHSLSGREYLWTKLYSGISRIGSNTYDEIIDMLSGIDLSGIEDDLLTICSSESSAGALVRVLQTFKEEITTNTKTTALQEDAGLSDITPEVSTPTIVQEEPQIISQLNTILPLVQSLEGSHTQGKRDWVTTEQIAEAKAVPMELLARRLGYDLKKEGKSFRFERDKSITISNNLWTDRAPSAGGLGGSTIDFLTKYHSPGISFQDAVREIHRLCLSPIDELSGAQEWLKAAVERSEKPQVEFVLPEHSMTARDVVEYLTHTRGIAEEIVIEQLRNGNLYQSTPYDNCCFVGYDTRGTARSAFQRGISDLRGKRFLGEVQGSCKEYPFVMKGTSAQWLYVFESAIDALSHATFAKLRGVSWSEHSRISLNGVSTVALERYLDDHEGVIGVTLCLDNDEAGLNAVRNISKFLRERYTHILVEIETPKAKDVNEDLLFSLGMQSERYEPTATPTRERGI